MAVPGMCGRGHGKLPAAARQGGALTAPEKSLMRNGSTQWVVARPLTASQADDRGQIHPLIAQILQNRGLSTPAGALAWLNGPGARVDPWAMKGMQAAVARVRAALRGREVIVVYGDFDADGVTATALLLQTLQALGARAQAYIPDRESEGYGLNGPALSGLAQAGARAWSSRWIAASAPWTRRRLPGPPVWTSSSRTITRPAPKCRRPAPSSTRNRRAETRPPSI